MPSPTERRLATAAVGAAVLQIGGAAGTLAEILLRRSDPLGLRGAEPDSRLGAIGKLPELSNDGSELDRFGPRPDEDGDAAH